MKIQISFLIDNIFYKKYENMTDDFMNNLSNIGAFNIEITEQQTNIIKNNLENIYLDYTNNYLTVDKMAEDLEIDKSDLAKILEIGKKINNKR